jgi:hypothetical protein
VKTALLSSSVRGRIAKLKFLGVNREGEAKATACNGIELQYEINRFPSNEVRGLGFSSGISESTAYLNRSIGC